MAGLVADAARADQLELTVADAHAIMTQDKMAAVEIELDEASAAEFADFTQERIGKVIEFYANDELLLAPVLRKAIRGRSIVINAVTEPEEAIYLAMVLRSGEVRIMAADPK